MCKDRTLSACPGEWEPGCDLGNNPAHVRRWSKNDMQTDREKAIEKLWQNSGHGTRWADVAAAYNAGAAAERERWRLRVIGLQAQYGDTAGRSALKHAADYGMQDEA